MNPGAYRRTAGRTFRVMVAKVMGSNAIGAGNRLPWRVAADMRRFRERTTGCAVVMGRKTWESLPKRYLPGRLNIVLTRHPGRLAGERVLAASSLTAALDLAAYHQTALQIRRTWVIGGERVYREALERDECEAVEMTLLRPPRPARYDAFFPAQLPRAFARTRTERLADGVYCETWQRSTDPVSPEHAYLQLLRDVLAHGELVRDRTGVGTLQTFGRSLAFPLDDPDGRIPVVTTKRVHWKSVAEEMLMFCRGDVDARELAAKGVRIWNGHTSRAYLDSIGATHIPTGSLGKAYGWQWRRWGMPYVGPDKTIQREVLEALSRRPGSLARRAALAGLKQRHPAFVRELPAGVWYRLHEEVQVYDQLAGIVDSLRNDPRSRRMLLSGWNVAELGDMALPPCHVVYAFNTTGNRLNCQVLQRSWDLFLGAPFNIAGAALLVRLLCHTIPQLQPGLLKIDAVTPHIYVNHVDQVREQLAREPYRFPILEITRRLPDLDAWSQLTADDLVLHERYEHGALAAPMAV